MKTLILQIDFRCGGKISFHALAPENDKLVLQMSNLVFGRWIELFLVFCLLQSENKVLRYGGAFPCMILSSRTQRLNSKCLINVSNLRDFNFSSVEVGPGSINLMPRRYKKLFFLCELRCIFPRR